ncbi:MAG TPA: hypothetical protein VF756_11950 [Thermoanaerobaculia bacterium]
MRKLTLLTSLSKVRLTLLGLAAVMVVLAFLSQAQPISAQTCNGYQYCTSWKHSGSCCYSSSGYTSRQYKECTDGLGHFCRIYRCYGPCPL